MLNEPTVTGFVSPVSRRRALQGLGAVAAAGALSMTGRSVVLAGEGTCDKSDSDPSANLSAFRQDAAGFPELRIEAQNYSFTMDATATAGWTNVTLVNNTGTNHHAMFMKLNEGVTTDDFMAAMQAPDFGALFGISVSHGGPNGSSSVIMNLEAGQYVVICAVPDENGMPHYAMGMYAPLEVTAGDTTMQAPSATARVELVDFMFHDLPLEVPAGENIWEIVNTGQQVHELVVYKQAPGVPYSVIEEIFLNAPVASPEASPMAGQASPEAVASPVGQQGPPFMPVGGTAPKNPGQTNYAVLTFDPGDYFAICFVPDPASGAPHFVLGMILPFTVREA